MSEHSFFGMSGHFHVLSLFLRRGYNVAIPAVDVGDDAIVIDDGSHELRRLQIKSGNPSRAAADFIDVVFKLSRQQLRDPTGAPLYYMLTAWVWERWSFVLIPREELSERKAARGMAIKPDERACDALKLTVRFSRTPSTRVEHASLWGVSLDAYLNSWVDWPERSRGRDEPPLVRGSRGHC